MSKKLHPSYLNLKKNLEIDLTAAGQYTLYFERAISSEYYNIDKLKQEIEEIKTKHFDEILVLKEKISKLIDQNYKLHQSTLGKD
jgi:rubrerythrin